MQLLNKFTKDKKKRSFIKKAEADGAASPGPPSSAKSQVNRSDRDSILSHASSELHSRASLNTDIGPTAIQRRDSVPVDADAVVGRASLGTASAHQGSRNSSMVDIRTGSPASPAVASKRPAAQPRHSHGPSFDGKPAGIETSRARPITMFYSSSHTGGQRAGDDDHEDEDEDEDEGTAGNRSRHLAPPPLENSRRPFSFMGRGRTGSVDNLKLAASKGISSADLTPAPSVSSNNSNSGGITKFFGLPRANRSSNELARPAGVGVGSRKISSPVLIHPSHALNDLAPTLQDLIKDEEVLEQEREAANVSMLSNENEASFASVDSAADSGRPRYATASFEASGRETRTMSPPPLKPSLSSPTDWANKGADPMDNWFSRVHSRSARPVSMMPGELTSATGKPTITNHRKLSGRQRPKSTFINLSANNSPVKPDGGTSATTPAAPPRPPPPFTIDSAVESVRSTLTQDIPSELDLADDSVLLAVLPRAVDDTQGFIPLAPDHLESIKKDQVLLTTRIRGLETRLELETKMRDAARSLSLLHANSKKMAKQAKEQLDNTNRKVSQALEELRTLNQRYFQNQLRLQQHSAAILRHAYLASQQRRQRALRPTMPSVRRDQLGVHTPKGRPRRASAIPIRTIQESEEEDDSDDEEEEEEEEGGENGTAAGQSGATGPEVELFMDRMREMERRLVSIQEDHRRTQEALDHAHVQLDDKEMQIVELREDLERSQVRTRGLAADLNGSAPTFQRSTTSFSASSLSNSTTALSPSIYRSPSACLEALEQDMHGVSLPAWTQDPAHANESSIHLQSQIEELKAEKAELGRQLAVALEIAQERTASGDMGAPTVTVDGHPAAVGTTGSSNPTSDLRLSDVPASRLSQSSFMNDAVSVTSQFGEMSTLDDETASLKRALAASSRSQEGAEAALKEEKFQIRKFKGSLHASLDPIEALLADGARHHGWRYPAAPFDRANSSSLSLVDPTVRLRAVQKQIEYVMACYGALEQAKDAWVERVTGWSALLDAATPRASLDMHRDLDDDDDNRVGEGDEEEAKATSFDRALEHLVDERRAADARLRQLEADHAHLSGMLEDLRPPGVVMNETRARSASVPGPADPTTASAYAEQITQLEQRLSTQSLELAELREALDAAQTQEADTQVHLAELTTTHRHLQRRLRDKEDELDEHKTRTNHLQTQMAECQRTHFTPAMMDKERRRLFAEHEAQLSRIRMSHTAQLHKTHGGYLAKEQQLTQRDETLRREVEAVLVQVDHLTRRCTEFETERGRYEHKIDDLRHQVYALETALAHHRVDRIIGWSDTTHLHPVSSSPSSSAAAATLDSASIRLPMSPSPLSQAVFPSDAKTPLVEEGEYAQPPSSPHPTARSYSSESAAVRTEESGPASGTQQRPNLGRGLGISSAMTSNAAAAGGAASNGGGMVKAADNFLPLTPPSTLAALAVVAGSGGMGSPGSPGLNIPGSPSSTAAMNGGSTTHTGVDSRSASPSLSLHGLNPQKFAKYYPQLQALRDEFRELVVQVRTQHRRQLDGLVAENKQLAVSLRQLKQGWDDQHEEVAGSTEAVIPGGVTATDTA
ncbi:hypothetical protein IWQ60_010225 [Tieghemiomyces parasiticus]|uniref:Up-regulated during septation protein 1 domain-containing protein n=1 Tax=Tieghemiomyces parasiticus TaxID=78921 RepID=A0A9W8DN29_9FUNG|nr:hypothetical protein IWQ60_010225 [Tieghemiomyces parasiticus]